MSNQNNRFIAHNWSPADLQREKKYSPMGGYNQSKLANVMFGLELNRLGQQAGITSIVLQPGTSNTGIQRHAPKFLQKIGGLFIDHIAGQPTHRSAHYSLFAATAPLALAGTYMGPSGRGLKGVPGVLEVPPKALDQEAVNRLWELSEQLTDVHYDFN